MDQLDNLPCHGLDLLDGVHPVVRPDCDPVRHLLLHLVVLVLVALLLHLQSDVWEMKMTKNISKKQFELNPQLGNGNFYKSFEQYEVVEN